MSEVQRAPRTPYQVTAGRIRVHLHCPPGGQGSVTDKLSEDDVALLDHAAHLFDLLHKAQVLGVSVDMITMMGGSPEVRHG